MPQEPLYPIFVDLRNRPVLIVGGGGVALRKATGLVEAGGRVTVVSPAFCGELESLGVTRIAQPYDRGHMSLSPWRLVFAATNVRGVNEQVALDAAERGVLCCRCDEPESGEFVGGAMGAVGGIRIAVSTGKASPVIAARIRDAAVAAIDPVLAQLADLLAAWRPVVLSRLHDEAARRTLLRRIAGEEMEATLKSGGRSAAEALFNRWLAEATTGGPHGR